MTPPQIASMLAAVHTSAGSVDELLAGAERREPFVNPDGRSSAAFERVWIGGAPHIVKYIHLDDDFTMRVSGDIGCRPVTAWEMGLLDAVPECVDHAVVGCARRHGRNRWGAAILMRDISDELLPDDGSTIRPDQYDAFLDHLAGFYAGSWGWRDEGQALLPYAARWAWFGVAALDGEERLGWPERVPQVAHEGWDRFARRAPQDVVAAVDELRHDVTPLADALRSTPSCFLHGDVKASNAGRAGDGRTVLIDWAYVGEGPACYDLVWHLALDRDRLPVDKLVAAESFRRALDRHGVETSAWWDHQLRLCLLGGTVLFGWEKAYGDDDELGWWCDVARDGAGAL